MSNLNQNKNSNPIDKNLLDLISKHWGAYCPSCGGKKDLNELKIIRKVGNVSQLLSECRGCGMKTFITAFPNLGMHISQIKSDLDGNEFSNFNAPITNEDYLNFYSATKNLSNLNDLINHINSKNK